MGRNRRSAVQPSTHGTTNVRTHSTGALRALAAGGLVLGLWAPAAAAHGTLVLGSHAASRVQDAARTPERYVTAGSTGAVLLNLPDDKGRRVLDVKGGTPLAVYPSRTGTPYLRVAAPGGVEVWVFGKYLKETSRAGWLEVTGSYVNMRPLPRSQDSYPLGQLDRGERLRFIERQSPSLPMADDWVKVWSPADTLAYVLAAETTQAPANANGQVLFETATAAAVASRPGVALPVNASTPPSAQPGAQPKSAPAAGTQAAGSPTIYAKLNAANQSMDTALATASGGGATPDYAALLASYTAILAMGPDAPTRSLVAQRIDKLEAYRELDEIRAEITLANSARQEQLEELREAAERNLNERDPLWGRFQSRGFLERQNRDGKSVFLVRWGSDFLAQVQCSSGRYDMALYEGFEIGIKGVSVRSAQGAAGAYPLIDIDRIEVISARR